MKTNTQEIRAHILSSLWMQNPHRCRAWGRAVNLAIISHKQSGQVSHYLTTSYIWWCLKIIFFFSNSATLVCLTKMEKLTALLTERDSFFVLLQSYLCAFIMIVHLSVHIISYHLKVNYHFKEKDKWVNNLFDINLWLCLNWFAIWSDSELWTFFPILSITLPLILFAI